MNTEKNPFIVSNDTYEDYLKKTEAQGCPECGSDYIEHLHSEYCGQEVWYWLCRKCDHQWDHGFFIMLRTSAGGGALFAQVIKPELAGFATL